MNFITHRLIRTTLHVVFLFVLCTEFFCAKSEAVTYTITDIGALNLNLSYALDINNHSQVTGYSGSPSKVFLYQNATLTNLGSLIKNQPAIGNSINNLGQITGWGILAGGQYNHALFYDGNTMRDIGTLGGNNSTGLGINDHGHVVGGSSLADPNVGHAFIYDGTTMRDIGTLGGPSSAATAINNNGYVTGDSTLVSSENVHAFVYDGTIMRDLGTFGGPHSSSEDINELGHVVGTANLPSGEYRAFYYDGTTMMNIGSLGGESFAYGLNNLGQVVGISELRIGGSDRAFIYDSLNGMVNLNSLIPADSGWILRGAYSINDLGQIVGKGEIDGTIHGFILTPVPEPGTILIGIIAAVGLVVRARNRMAAKAA